MAEFDSGQLRQWAVKGAEQRLQEIAGEAAAIYQAFPELRDASPRTAAAAAAPAARKAGGKRRGNMSAAQRRAVSERMRKYWAGRRESADGGSESTGSAKAASGRPARAVKKSSGPRKMSPAARKRISDAQKKRWADRRRANA